MAFFSAHVKRFEQFGHEPGVGVRHERQSLESPGTGQWPTIRSIQDRALSTNGWTSPRK
jgi:hypothetical protein